MTIRCSTGFAVVLAAGLAAPALAQMQPFHGYDYLVPPNGPMPNAASAHAAWLAAATPLSAIGVVCYDFNQMPVNTACPPGPFNAAGTTLIGFPGGIVAFNPVIPATGGVILTGNTESVANGWDTTTAPWFDLQNRLSLVVPFQSSTVNYAYDLTFNPPIQAFGMFVTGEGNTVTGGQMFLTFTDSSASWMIPMDPNIGGQFVGFIDPGQAITRVTLMLTPDTSGTVIQPFISLDDICVVWAHGPGCPADFDGSGFVDLEDFAAFVHAFEAGTDDADFDGSGFVDLDDYHAFVLAFEKGC
ncbi:MAG: hypothetical protein IT435_04550 [Phycisphaerales bacterium]|nr:hypothetical protein [Phycisphaerales bacterium]